jgi:hypothetical protein
VAPAPKGEEHRGRRPRAAGADDDGVVDIGSVLVGHGCVPRLSWSGSSTIEALQSLLPARSSLYHMTFTPSHPSSLARLHALGEADSTEQVRGYVNGSALANIGTVCGGRAQGGRYGFGVSGRRRRDGARG